MSDYKHGVLALVFRPVFVFECVLRRQHLEAKVPDNLGLRLCKALGKAKF